MSEWVTMTFVKVYQSLAREVACTTNGSLPPNGRRGPKVYTPLHLALNDDLNYFNIKIMFTDGTEYA